LIPLCQRGKVKPVAEFLIVRSTPLFEKEGPGEIFFVFMERPTAVFIKNAPTI
jgi:hypothetical protein